MKTTCILSILSYLLINHSELHFTLSHSSDATASIDIYCVSKNQRTIVRRELSRRLFGSPSIRTLDLYVPENNRTTYILKYTFDYE